MMLKSEIVLSANHPSLLEDVFTKSSLYAPVVVSQDSILIDGYRRFRMEEGPDISAVRMDVPSVFSAALEMNSHTRLWDEIDRFLWARWANSLGIERTRLQQRGFPAELDQAPALMISALANRKLQFGQAARIVRAPARTWSFFTEILSSNVRFNVNETAHFIEMTFDLANRWQTKNLSEVLQNSRLQKILADKSLDARQTGEALLKEMRTLRYPLHQRRTEELSIVWQQLDLERLQAKKSLLLDRGILELTIRAHSHDDMSNQVRALLESLNSPAWNRIWDHDL